MEYKFVTVVNKGVINRRFESETGMTPREIIEEYAQRSYRFVGILPISYVGYGTLNKYDLVFEKI